MKEYLSEIEQVIVNSGQTQVLDEFFDLLGNESHYLFKIKLVIQMLD
jgi:hypothetical protein